MCITTQPSSNKHYLWPLFPCCCGGQRSFPGDWPVASSLDPCGPESSKVNRPSITSSNLKTATGQNLLWPFTSLAWRPLHLNDKKQDRPARNANGSLLRVLEAVKIPSHPPDFAVQSKTNGWRPRNGSRARRSFLIPIGLLLLQQKDFHTIQTMISPAPACLR